MPSAAPWSGREVFPVNSAKARWRAGDGAQAAQWSCSHTDDQKIPGKEEEKERSHGSLSYVLMRLVMRQ